MYDALIILGGGVSSQHTAPEWVKRRIDMAVSLQDKTKYFIPSSFVTPHKAPHIDENGLIVSDAYVIGNELLKHNIKPNRILYENYSVDTIGNILFTRLLHTDILKLKYIAIITSEFQMPRAKVLAEWIMKLPPHYTDYTIDYISVSDAGIDQKILQPRIEKEIKRTKQALALKEKLTTLTQLHNWIYTKHAGYTLNLRDKLIHEKSNNQALKTY